MINILSIRCSFAFAPYLTTSFAEFVDEGLTAPRVVRQGGQGLILRTDGDLVLRHEHRQSYLGKEEARHYAATVQFRSEVYDVLRMQDEVVLANVGEELLLSHPQSEMWLDRVAVTGLVSVLGNDSIAIADQDVTSFPQWLRVSTGGGRFLLSDQRTARWVLLADDHLRELTRRLGSLRPAGQVPGSAPTTIPLKGLTVHLQSAFKLTETLEEFVNTGSVTPLEEVTPFFSLKASVCTEGIELRDSGSRVALTAREARKWTGIINTELERLNARHVERGRIRTVFADSEDGRWILQWGDEVHLPNSAGPLTSQRNGACEVASGPITKRSGEFLLLLSRATGACVALTESESIDLVGSTDLSTRLDPDPVCAEVARTD